MNRSQHITSLVKSFHEDGVVNTAWDIGKGLHAGLSSVGKATTWGLHKGDELLHQGANFTALSPTATGTAALGTAAYLRHRHNVKKRDRASDEY